MLPRCSLTHHPTFTIFYVCQCSPIFFSFLFFMYREGNYLVKEHQVSYGHKHFFRKHNQYVFVKFNSQNNVKQNFNLQSRGQGVCPYSKRVGFKSWRGNFLFFQVSIFFFAIYIFCIFQILVIYLFDFFKLTIKICFS